MAALRLSSSAMQRLFTTFPDSLPGAGLLLLRVSSLVAALQPATSTAFGVSDKMLPAIHGLGWAVCGLLILGLFTPFVAAAQGLLEFWKTMAGDAPSWVHVVPMLVAFSLALLGPGAWSLDAHLFGLKRIKLH